MYIKGAKYTGGANYSGFTVALKSNAKHNSKDYVQNFAEILI